MFLSKGYTAGNRSRASNIVNGGWKKGLKNKAVNQTNKMLFSICFTTFMFKGTKQSRGKVPHCQVFYEFSQRGSFFLFTERQILNELQFACLFEPQLFYDVVVVMYMVGYNLSLPRSVCLSRQG